MQVSFEGICLWDREALASGVLGIMRNASAGDIVDNTPIPPHIACVIVETARVDTALSVWNEPPEAIAFRGLPHSLYRLLGDDISFDPPPTGGAPDVLSLAKAGCASGRVIDPAFRAATPSAADVAARIELPATANLTIVPNGLGAELGLLAVNDATSLVARRFDGTVRRLSFLGSNPRVIVANVDVPLAIADPENPVDDDHGLLYCPMFVESDNPPPFAMRGDVGGNLLFPASVGDLPRLPESVRAVRTRRRRRGERVGDFFTLGSGCSNTQYP